MANLADKLVPVARALLEPGETLTGCCVGTWQKTFSGRMVAIAVAPGRIIVQPVNRRWEPNAEPVLLPRDHIVRASITGGGGDWLTAPSIVMDAASVAVHLTSTDGLRLKLMLMTGEGLLGSLGGGEIQRHGVQALAEFCALG
ncbi:hypothetical protein BH09ACT4_BH09ACT4_00220 [soil metagenome]